MDEVYEADVQLDEIYVPTFYLDEDSSIVTYYIDKEVIKEKYRICEQKQWTRVPIEKLNMTIIKANNPPVVMEDFKQLGYYVPKDPNVKFKFHLVDRSASN